MSMNPMVAGSRLVGAQADAMRTAAANEGGAMQGFMGMGMAMNAGGMNAQNLFAMGQQQQPQATIHPAPAAAPAPAADGWKCACGATATGKFCPECGAKKPAGIPQYKCDKCGWEPEKGVKTPKFCPEGGDPFDNGDIV